MATKKVVPIKRFAKGRPDRYVEKEDGAYCSQSVRMTVADNRLIRAAAEREQMSINHWLYRTIMAAARQSNNNTQD